MTLCAYCENPSVSTLHVQDDPDYGAEQTPVCHYHYAQINNEGPLAGSFQKIQDDLEKINAELDMLKQDQQKTEMNLRATKRMLIDRIIPEKPSN